LTFNRNWIITLLTRSTSRELSHLCAINAGKGFLRRKIKDDFQNITAREKAVPKWAKDMESSKRYLLQAEIEYWHEMLQLNVSRITKSKETEMRSCLKQAVRALNSNPSVEFRVAA
jgi:hypothetical protein